MGERKIIDYSDFSGGEFGLLEPWRAPPGTWTGKNIVQYDNGSLGPRNGLIEVGLSASITGQVMSAGPFSRRTESNVWVLVNNAGTRTAKTIEADGTVTNLTLTDAVPAATEPVQSQVFDDIEYLSIVSNGLYKIDPDTNAFSKVANAPGSRCFIQHGERFFSGGGDTLGFPVTPSGVQGPANRLWYSEPDDPEDWPSLNFIDVVGAIVGLYSQRNQLVIVTTEGWWLLTGVPGVNDTLRRQIKSEFPTWPTQGTIVEPSCNLAFVHGSLQQRDGEDEGEIAVHSLGVFTAATLEYATHMKFGSGQNIITTPPTYQAVTLRGPEDWFVQGGTDTAENRAVLYRNKAWQRIEWEIAGVDLLGWCICMRRTDRLQFLTHTSNNIRMYEWRAYNNRPAFVSDNYTGPGDDSDTPFVAEFSLPEHHEENGSDLGLVDIVVDFTSWDTGTTETNHFDLVPKVLRAFEDDEQVAPTLTFDEAVGESPATLAGKRRRKRFQGVAHGLDGTGFRLFFNNIRGVAINRVQVLVDVDGPRVGE